MYGIDISAWNGNINLAPYKGQFVIIRVGYGLTHIDKCFKRNADECIRLGIPFGFYWYSYALNVADARTEADAFLKAIMPYKDKIRCGVWFDMEDADHYKQKHGFSFTRANVSNICNAFCSTVEKAGFYTGIYASLSWFGSYIACPRFDKWVASWGSNDGNRHGDVSSIGTLHQYTSKPLDKNYMYVDIDTYRIKRAPEPYSGDLEIKIPKRGHFKEGDGYERNTSFKTSIRKIQRFLNWAMNMDLAIDGCYGKETKATCKAFQKKAGMGENTKGQWGAVTAERAKNFKK